MRDLLNRPGSGLPEPGRAGPHHRHAVVGNGHGAGRFHGPVGRQFLAQAALGDGPDGKDVDGGIPAGAFARPLPNIRCDADGDHPGDNLPVRLGALRVEGESTTPVVGGTGDYHGLPHRGHLQPNCGGVDEPGAGLVHQRIRVDPTGGLDHPDIGWKSRHQSGDSIGHPIQREVIGHGHLGRVQPDNHVDLRVELGPPDSLVQPIPQ